MLLNVGSHERRKPRGETAHKDLREEMTAKTCCFQATPDVDVSTSTFRVASTQHATRTTYIMCWYSHSHDV
jgi:hypothetical protein